MLLDLHAMATDMMGDNLAAVVRETFPSLTVGHVRIEQAGGDHVLLIVDDRFAFRFPRRDTHDLTLEIAVLERLRDRAVPAMPSYDYIDPNGRFGGYPFIAGSPLSPARFAALSALSRDAMLAEAGQFLSELHSIQAATVVPDNQWPRAWTAAQYAERGLTMRLPELASRMPAIASILDEFYMAYRRDQPKALVVVHGDLVGEHILIDERSESLSGIIDFGDVALGDPAQDFLGFWAYGADAAFGAVDHYRPASPDAGLLARSRRHFIRYRLDRLFEGLRDGDDIDWHRAQAEIATLLDAPQAFSTHHDDRRR
jgi:aminoglycoside 2''-phosphotransferase